MLYEALLLLGVLSITFLVPTILLGIVSKITPAPWLLWLHIFVVLAVYFCFFWSRRGQTLAMQTWKIRVVDAVSGLPLSLNQCLIRYALSWLSIAFFGAGILWAVFDRDHQFLHDRLARSKIVYQ